MPKSGSPCYLDSSALVKLILTEPESSALRRHLRSRPLRVASSLVRVEVIRAVRPHGPEAVQRAWAVLDELDVLAVDRALLDSAAMLDPLELRSLDAIHLASALKLEAGELVTYDLRMAGAAGTVGLLVTAPQ